MQCTHAVIRAEWTKKKGEKKNEINMCKFTVRSYSISHIFFLQKYDIWSWYGMAWHGTKHPFIVKHTKIKRKKNGSAKPG